MPTIKVLKEVENDSDLPNIKGTTFFSFIKGYFIVNSVQQALSEHCCVSDVEMI